MRKLLSSPYVLMALILLVPVIVYAGVRWWQNRYDELPVFSSMRNPVDNDYHFQNQDGALKTFNDWNGKTVVVNFIFTTCPNICPKMTNNMKTIAKAFADKPDVQLLSFSVNPDNDTPQKLKEYAAKRGANFGNGQFLTGDKRAIYKLARKEFYLTATDGDGGPQDFIHSDRLVLVDTKHNIRGYYDGTSPKEADQLINDLKKLQHEN